MGGRVKGTLAVAINQTGLFTERFVERHIRESFGGRTCVVARHTGGAPRFEQPVWVADALELPLAARLAAFPQTMAAYAASSYWGIPVGAEREAIRAFWRTHGVFAVLAEFGPLGCWIAPVARAHGVPVFVYFRGYDASRKLGSRRSVAAYRHMATQVDGFFAVSHFLVDNLARAGVVHPNTHVIPSGTNPRVFRPGAKDPDLVVAVGRLVGKKQPDLTVRAFARAARQHPRARFEIVGDGPMLERCRMLAASEGVAGRVVFHGPRDHAFVAELLGRAQLFVQHSVTDAAGETEGLPSSIQEAMAAGAVVVTTRHAGIPEAVTDGETGWLVDEHDEDGFARVLDKALADPVRIAEMSRAGRRFAEDRLDTTKLQAQLEQAILAVLETRGPAGKARGEVQG
jgi:colanic acid/amylovoran biosynthesis glycosyltransferase